MASVQCPLNKYPLRGVVKDQRKLCEECVLDLYTFSARYDPTPLSRPGSSGLGGKALFAHEREYFPELSEMPRLPHSFVASPGPRPSVYGAPFV